VEDNNTGVNRPCTLFLIITGLAFFLAKDPFLASPLDNGRG
jgi:hypothetical protein